MKPIKKSNQNDPGEMTLAEFEELAKTDPNAAENFLAEIYQGDPEMQKKLAELMDNLEQTLAEFELFRELRPYLEQELEKINPDYRHMTPAELEAAGILGKATERAREAWQKALSTEAVQIQYADTEEVKMPKDKLANMFFSLMAPQPEEINGQRKMIPAKYEGRNAKKEITLFYDYFFDEDFLKKFGLDKKFSDYDFFVVCLLDNLKAAGNEIVSVRKVWQSLGNTGNPSANQLEPLLNSLRKGLSTIIHIDNKEVLTAWGQDTQKYKKLVSPIMPIQLLEEKFMFNGGTTDATVKIGGYSPFFLLAQTTQQFTTFRLDLLKSYTGRKTPRFWSVLRYLLIQISWIKHPTHPRDNKIRLEALYEYTGETTPRTKDLAKQMAYRLLDECFIPHFGVDHYREDPQDGGIEIYLNPNGSTGKKKIPDKK